MNRMPKKGSILNRLTVELMDTFIHVNQVCSAPFSLIHRSTTFTTESSQMQNENKRTFSIPTVILRQTQVSNVQYYNYHLDECLNDRYVIKSSIGKVVIKCAFNV